MEEEGLEENFEGIDPAQAREKAKEWLAAADAHMEDEEGEKVIKASNRALQLIEISKSLGGGGFPEDVDCLRASFRGKCYQNKRKEALKLATEELEKRLQAKDARGEAVMRLCIAEIVLEKMGSKHRNEAIPNATKAAAIFRDLEELKLEATALLVLANTHIKRSAPAMDSSKGSQLAIDSAKDALQLFREIKDRRGEGLAMHAISVGYINLREYRQAIQMARQAVKIYKELGATRLEAFEHRVLARWHLRKDEPDQALAAAEQSYELFKQLEDIGKVQGWEIAALGTVVQTYLAAKDVDAAINAAKEGMKRVEARGDKAGQAAILDMLRQGYFEKSMHEDAMDCANKALALVREVEDRRFEAELLLQQAPLLGATCEADRATDNIQEAIGIFRELGLAKDEANALQFLSDAHLAKREERDALKAAEQTKNLQEKLDNLRGVAAAYISAGRVHHEYCRFREAQAAYQEALAIFREGNDRRGEAEALSYITRLHADNKDADKALETGNICRDIYLELGMRRCLLDITLLLSKLEMLVARDLSVTNADAAAIGREVTKALEFAREAVEMAWRMDDPKAVVLAQHAEIEVLVAAGESEAAMRIIKDGLAMCKERRMEMEEGRLLSDMAQVHIGAKDWPKADECAKKAVDIAQKVGDAEGEKFCFELLEHIEEQTMGPRRALAPGEAVQMAVPEGDAVPAAAAPEAASSQASKAPAVYQGPPREALSKRLQELVMDMFDAEDLENDTLLMDIGIDSLSMLDFHSRIQKEFSSVSWSTTMLFDYPTIGELSSMMDEELRSAFKKSIGH
eukprot:TRINITY_DN44226_c0_g1_i1.p1 TRINITY_DN44226_c0_g1~~TRINITY_DN44226_c0_g1_i1.p1  ORF type:complete len:803 (-),score=222.84 TRINITY_DN44226_c0_g1_i1:107-2515(-)